MELYGYHVHRSGYIVAAILVVNTGPAVAEALAEAMLQAGVPESLQLVSRGKVKADQLPSAERISFGPIPVT